MKSNNHLRFILFLTGILLATHLLHAQSQDQNYITSQTFKDSICSQTNIQYYDGLGRSSELLQLHASPEGKHIAIFNEYDGLGREVRKWLPYPVIPYNNDYVPAGILKDGILNIYNDTKPYSLNEYEPSPLNRFSKQYGPGMSWQDSGRGISNEYLSSQSANKMYSCKYYEVENFSNNTLVHLTCKPIDCTNMFNITIREEDNEKILNFTNGRGLNILTRQIAGNIFYDTYYVYDDYDNLRVVLPPVASDSLNVDIYNPKVINNVLSKYAYLYQFDARNRCIAKKLPDCEWIYYVYDNADRLIFTQDGVQRTHSEWTFTIPDTEGRTCLKGICQNDLQVWDTPLKTSTVTAIKDTNSQLDSGYNITGISLSSPTLLEADYYDDYSFLDIPFISPHKISLLGDNSVPEFSSPSASVPRGLPTGTVYMHLYDGTTISYICTVNYYDTLERIVQTKSLNHLGGYDWSYLSYNLADELLAEKHVHHAGNNEKTLTEQLTHTYDLMGRLLTTTYQLDNSTPVLLTDNKYDALGHLQKDNRNGNPSLQTEYSYNIRSWLNEVSNPLFRQTLHYTDGVGTSYYNGNISSMTWQNGTGQPERGYKFEYDLLNRLTNAHYGEGSKLSENSDQYTEQITDYDKMGNILGLLRYGKTSATGYGLIDNLSFTLDGNRLKSVNDVSTLQAYGNGFEFKDNTKQTIEYSYDANGNLTKDLNKKVTDIQYNCLNLPCRIEFEDGNITSYLYAADGTKLRTTHIIGNDTTVTDYCDNVIYENGIAKMLSTETGYVSLTDGKYHYYLKDHQGNNRVVADENGKVEERNDYYPFGGLMASSSVSAQPYKYNGKELDRKGGLDWYDYGARHYDATLGRWHVVDLMAEKYYGVSPYSYCLNNPILLIDPNGMWPTWGGIKKSLNKTLDTSMSFANGAVRAVADNMLLGSTSLRETGIYSSASAYNAGQDIGDVVSLFIGGAEVITGAGEVTAGVLGTPETAGASLAVSAKGAMDVTHGSLMATSGAMKLFSRKGRVNKSNDSEYAKTSGRNEPHANLDKRQQASNNYKIAKENYDKLKSKANKTAEEKKELETLRKQKDRYKKQMDYTGDHDHQTGRGGN